MTPTVLMSLWKDEAGFIISAELVLVATIAVLALIVGLSEIAGNLNNELEDVATGFGRVDQGYRYSGLSGHMGQWNGSGSSDTVDYCDTHDVQHVGATGEGG